jgi:Mitochondrial K+-H+ exchange-related
MRILLLPLTRRQTLLYAQRLTLNEATKPNPWLTWVLTKAQKTWSNWGKSETKWKNNTVALGNRLLGRIEWEEYALKTVHDPKTTTSYKVRSPLIDTLT